MTEGVTKVLELLTAVGILIMAIVVIGLPSMAIWERHKKRQETACREQHRPFWHKKTDGIIVWDYCPLCGLEHERN